MLIDDVGSYFIIVNAWWKQSLENVISTISNTVVVTYGVGTANPSAYQSSPLCIGRDRVARPLFTLWCFVFVVRLF